MPYTEAVLAEYANRLPPVEETKEKLRLYVQRADLTLRQFAQLTGYSLSAITNFLGGRYLSYGIKTDLPLRDAIESAIERYPVGAPETAAEGRLYETENVADLRRWFERCHRDRALAFCYGPPGSQKTFVLKHLVAEFNRRELRQDSTRNRAFYIRASVNIRPRDLLAKMCIEAGALSGPSMQKCITGLRIHLRATKAVFVVDEAQLLGIPTLEAVRELYDEPPQIGVLLAGSHGLKKLFDQRAAELEQWNSRLEAGIELTGVSEARAAAIIQAELPGLSPKQVKGLVDGARVQDAYSRDQRTYLNVRRLFKTVAAVREELSQRINASSEAKAIQ